MTVSLKGLPDALRGAVWPSSARTVKRPVNSGNGRDPCFQSLLSSPEEGHSEGTARATWRKERATVGLYSPKLLGDTRHTMVRTMGPKPERVRKTPKPILSAN